MNTFLRQLRVLACLLVACLLVPACTGEKKVTVTGNIARGGQPLKLSPTGVLLVTLVPEAPPNDTYTSRIAECDQTGAFTIKEVTPGKYKIGVEQFDPNPQIDKLNAAFRADTGKIIREIDGKAPLAIDLAKPAGG